MVDGGQEIKSKVENKLMSMWANMKYGWTVKLKTVTFNKDHPIFLLGKFYRSKDTPLAVTPVLDTELTMPPKEDSFELGQECDEADAEDEDDGMEGFKRDFISRLWFTYRREFQTMSGSNLTTDCGWGCMLRSGQMLLAQGLLVHFLGRSWRYTENPSLYQQSQEAMHRKIISWFGDNHSRSSPFSIHQLVKVGEDTGRKAGDWYGPNAVANLIRKSHLAAKKEVADLDKLSVYVAQNCTIFIQDVMDQCLINDKDVESLPPWHPQAGAPVPGERRTWKSLILLVPLRLGGIKFNPIYGQSLKGLLTLENCLGIIGGRPKHSLYFMGFQEDKLIFLDPHYCQENVDVHEEDFSVSSFHCKSPRKMRINKLDPCCCVGFYCATRMDFEQFITNVEPYLIPVGGSYDLNSAAGGQSMSSSLNLANYPMFVFSQGRSADQEESYFQHFYGDKEKNYQEADDRLGLDVDDDLEFEEFVII